MSSDSSIPSSLIDASGDNVRKAAEFVMNADAILVTAGAGMGVDSGLPDFRGVHGFWKAYPPFKERGIG
eukprot:CAMPEP_0196786948 /NCGR_PEP_ID=MMETSP1104-20130614/22330_1 /TAXON_ID=33652 /ORGANISM="Cafeteria sp., Strain Caron Lab Isolate" /LENGTH=68 /DNA_ID=CAMNT_0042157277 /DNA_START=1 /DNA_END=203 /DNA_ORIENTATION=+